MAIHRVQSNTNAIAFSRGLHIFPAGMKSVIHHRDRWKPFMCNVCGLLKYPSFNKRRMLVNQIHLNGHKVCSHCYKNNYTELHKKKLKINMSWSLKDKRLIVRYIDVDKLSFSRASELMGLSNRKARVLYVNAKNIQNRKVNQ
jgi:hypothetical protein